MSRLCVPAPPGVFTGIDSVRSALKKTPVSRFTVNKKALFVSFHCYKKALCVDSTDPFAKKAGVLVHRAARAPLRVAVCFVW